MKNYSFTPPAWSTITVVIFLILFTSLGFWQLSRAKEKELIQESWQSQVTTQAIPIQALPKNEHVLRYQPVQITGHYDNSHSILLDNKVYRHKIGYEVLTPFIPVDYPDTILINRGWVPTGENRNTLPHIPDIPNQQTLQGMIYIPSGKPFTLGNLSENKDQWPLRIQALDLNFIQKQLGQSLFPYVILLNPDDRHGFVRDWQPVHMSSHKHIGYAVQWFTFALVLIIIHIGLNFRKKSTS